MAKVRLSVPAVDDLDRMIVTHSLYDHAMQSLERARAGETIALDEL